MKKVFVYYFRNKQYSNKTIDFIESLEKSIPKEDFFLIDLVNKLPNEERAKILKDYGFASSYINNSNNFNFPTLVAIESSFGNTFTGREALIKDDVIPAIQTQIINELYPPPPPDTGSGSGNNSGSSGGSTTPSKSKNWGWIIGGAVLIGILFFSKKSRK